MDRQIRRCTFDVSHHSNFLRKILISTWPPVERARPHPQQRRSHQSPFISPTNRFSRLFSYFGVALFLFCFILCFSFCATRHISRISSGSGSLPFAIWGVAADSAFVELSRRVFTFLHFVSDCSFYAHLLPFHRLSLVTFLPSTSIFTACHEAITSHCDGRCADYHYPRPLQPQCPVEKPLSKIDLALRYHLFSRFSPSTATVAKTWVLSAEMGDWHERSRFFKLPDYANRGSF